ncbi:aminotransferase class V-fold PLP-dependent enzyme [Streptomyces zagrosensis]|uniref:Selenocysteine lyase/cysteine desulfurase n=1 Tax=Streptomyces zagrosensis TaxID=1042984 RepID=A0A7W9Q4V6_9ACTN|nr:aminotransferase class V-fold PLP-dependent enzyme [Streptomyces zagrosensis]MBB5933664.1 selenocysteine lyase/cysteine desulfurase [Streptomyces zagrosensis]
MESLALDQTVREQFATETTYLNTASTGVLPRAAADAVRDAVAEFCAGRPYLREGFGAVQEARETFARLVGVGTERVAAGASVAVYAGLLATSLPPGAEVVVADNDFSSLVNPFAMRSDLKLRSVPLTEVADAVRPGTDLVAVSAVQSADGRIADLAAIRDAARTHGARTLIDASQATGWLPLRADDYDFLVTVGYKWLMTPRGAAFLVTPEDHSSVTPVFAGWVAGEEPYDSCYGTVAQLAHSARRFDESPALLAYNAARHSLALIERLGPERIGAHNTALADRFRAGLAALGHEPIAAPGSAIVAVPGLGHRAERLGDADVILSNRAGNLRAAFHLYNTEADVDRALSVLAN